MTQLEKTELRALYAECKLDWRSGDRNFTVPKSIMDLINKNFDPRTFIVGLAISETILAIRVKAACPNIGIIRTTSDLFQRVPRANSKGNTLTVIADGKKIGIRKFYNHVRDFFHSTLRSEFPSSAPYSTGMWSKYPQLLIDIFSLTTDELYSTLWQLVEDGLRRFEVFTEFTVNPRRRTFVHVLKKLNRTIPGVNGGVILQGITYGYFQADRPHLSVESFSSRTGSKRKDRVGDVEGYYGAVTEFVCEVKDVDLIASNTKSQLQQFANRVTQRKLKGIVVCRSADDDAHFWMASYNLLVITEEDLLLQLKFWDTAKLDVALNGLVHYLVHIERTKKGSDTLKNFIDKLPRQSDE